jgi:hypothetical protein
LKNYGCKIKLLGKYGNEYRILEKQKSICNRSHWV